MLIKCVPQNLYFRAFYKALTCYKQREKSPKRIHPNFTQSQYSLLHVNAFLSRKKSNSPILWYLRDCRIAVVVRTVHLLVPV